MRDLPSGTSPSSSPTSRARPQLLHELGADATREALAEHRRILREAFAAHGGVEVDTQGDAFFVAFPTAPAPAGRGRRRTKARPRGRSGCGSASTPATPLCHRARASSGSTSIARRGLPHAGHGGQVLVSAATPPSGLPALRDLGEHRLHGPLCARTRSTSSELASSRRYEPPPTNLPTPSTPFLGRERELAEVIGLLSQDGRPPADAHRSRRHGQDAPRGAGGRRARAPLPGRRVVGTARHSARSASWCSKRRLRHSAPVKTWPSTSPTRRCCWCSTTSSRSSKLPPSSRVCSPPAPTWRSS